jgi:hypothetical protein
MAAVPRAARQWVGKEVGSFPCRYCFIIYNWYLKLTSFNKINIALQMTRFSQFSRRPCVVFSTVSKTPRI